MTWQELRDKIDKLSEQQLAGQVYCQDYKNDDMLMEAHFSINDDKPYEEPYPIVDVARQVCINMPYFKLLY